jgi:hypothetical protein
MRTPFKNGNGDTAGGVKAGPVDPPDVPGVGGTAHVVVVLVLPELLV